MKTQELSMIKKPESLSATIGDLSGEIDLQWDSVEGASSYIIELSKGNQKHWLQADIVSASKYTLAELRANVIYRFRIAALNGRRQGPWSEVVSKKL